MHKNNELELLKHVNDISIAKEDLKIKRSQIKSILLDKVDKLQAENNHLRKTKNQSERKCS